MTDIGVNFIGMTAAILTTSSFIPQIIKIFKTRETKDISLWMYVAFSSGVFLWFIYGIRLNSLPIILANGIGFLFCITILVGKFVFDSRRDGGKL